MCNLSIAKNLSKGGGHLKMTSSLRGGSEIMTHDDKGGGGSKNAKMEVTSYVLHCSKPVISYIGVCDPKSLSLCKVQEFREVVIKQVSS